jgi:hypothetical protein
VPGESAIRTAQTLPSGVIAVSGEDQEATDPADHEPKTVAYGVRLIDPASWTWRTLDREAQDVTVAGGVLLARRWSCDCVNALPSIGLRAYDTAGKLLFTRFAGAAPIVRGVADGHAYVGVKRGRTRRIHVIDLDSGDSVRTLRDRELQLLDPRR